MKKKLALCMATLLTVLLLSSCGVQQAQIVMVTGTGGIDDHSFNQGAWEGIRLYAGLHGKTCYYYQPASTTNDAYMESIRKAEMGGAEVILLPGWYFENTLGEAQEKYPDVSFILLDCLPAVAPAANTVAITFAEEQAGYLAGWAAVTEGYRSLGFLGGEALPGVAGYGLGYAQGANAAAVELGVQVTLRYAYTGTFQPSAEVEQLAASWYQDDVEVIFACGGAMGESVFAAATAQGGKTIGVDIDQSGESETVLFSAVKGLGAAAGRTLEQFYGGAFPGGEALVMGAAESAVGLTMETSRLQNVTQGDYDALYARIAQGEDLHLDLSALTLQYEEVG